MYSSIALDHFANPRNVGVIDNADGYARVRSPVHHDLVEIYILVQDDRLVDIKYRVHGCVAVIASTSMASEMAKGRSLEDALALTSEQISRALGGLPQSKLACSVLAPQALEQAIGFYREAVSCDRDSKHANEGNRSVTRFPIPLHDSCT